jgi:hypothetical protein
MCICINCNFYKSCWINKGLHEIPKNFLKTSLNFNKGCVLFIENEPHIPFKQSIYLKIILNSFYLKQMFEFDVVECEGFCERPGYWLN